ncbi:hypothetical protein E1I18_00355 [Mycoplasmopsis mucosicanis]|uniref:Uncharacterized protein n=1 Tax=Mycoplasmopsis mucosicanis TaxID=458208 RepID=A0A507SYA6_9BACT|nr:hypothetical protein [Mycoplasmopsis mucosicanis]TQC54213.1 hypothetical protein E1I18_00355 [Mycoplasmopsis mucosicanis]
MRKINVKSMTIKWTIVGIIALIALIICSVIIGQITNRIESIKYVKIETLLIDQYIAYKAYGIGFLAFSIVVFLISASIAYKGYRSWNYQSTL